ncbi:transposase [Stenotrophomonas sp. NLF4-10]|uniref:REP-associated tyrosine transposase n=1 Tax=Stenotrophomonas sp. NLF4-10 TaxID=2918754 RepID=UPI001EFB1475|nr:transposase [Stenotrophomonas sp. NLF4-10]MCG8276220.1 transposase [Stenotrophomonas sp. NLF4-10]
MNRKRLRLGRRSIVGHTYMLTTVCHDRRRWFEDDAAARIVTARFRRLEQQELASSLAWVVMPDHVHRLMELRASTLGHVVQRFKSGSALLLNRRHGRSGPVWQSCYHDHAIRSDESLRQHAAYILANPIQAGLTERIGDYPHAWCCWNR